MKRLVLSVMAIAAVILTGCASTLDAPPSSDESGDEDDDVNE